MDQDFPLALSYDDVLLVPQYSEIKSRSDIDLSVQLTPKAKLGIPLLSSNMSDVTGLDMAIALGKLGGLGVIPRFMLVEKEADIVNEIKKHKLVAAAAVGCKPGEMERAEALVKAGVDLLFLDVANGHMLQAIETTTLLKQRFGKYADIVSGNVATKQGAEALFKAGADCVKVGIGAGTACITRIQTGSGVPQITATLDCAIAARRYKKSIICDAGTKNSGDIVKGLAAGASAIMAGSQFAGHDESPGSVVIKDGKKYKTYNGSASAAEKNKHTKVLNGLSKEYTSHVEGVESLVPYKGPVKNSVESWIAGIRSGFSYCGSKDIYTLWKNAKFIRVSSMGLKENGSHDVILAR